MESNSMFALIDIIIAGGGLYIVYMTVMMIKTGTLKQNGLMPKNLDIRKCRDTAGYIKFIGMKQLGFGILVLLCGAVGLIHDYTGMIGSYVYLIGIVLMVIYIVYYSAQIKKATRMFW